MPNCNNGKHALAYIGTKMYTLQTYMYQNVYAANINVYVANILFDMLSMLKNSLDNQQYPLTFQLVVRPLTTRILMGKCGVLQTIMPAWTAVVGKGHSPGRAEVSIGTWFTNSLPFFIIVCSSRTLVRCNSLTWAEVTFRADVANSNILAEVVDKRACIVRRIVRTDVRFSHSDACNTFFKY